MQLVSGQLVPRAGGMMTPLMASQAGRNIPPGLEMLVMVDRLIVNQQIDMLEMLTKYEEQNRYLVRAVNGQTVFYAIEDSNCCCRNCCGSARSFQMMVLDMYQREAIHIKRSFGCKSCCCPCCLHFMTVYSPPGTVVGYVVSSSLSPLLCY